VQLTSTSFISLLTVLAIVAIVATVWLMPRITGRGVKGHAARLGLLVACQLAIVLALSAGVNAYFLFYASWDDLLASGSSSVEVNKNGGAAKVPRAELLSRSAPELSAELGIKTPDRDGRLEQTTVRGLRTGLNAEAFVYLPPDYFKPENAKRNFPVVVVLTGYPGDPKILVGRQEMPKLVLEELRAGRTQPMIFAFVQSTVVPPRDTECTDVPGGPQVETFFAQDVPDALRATYRVAPTRDGWGLMGPSSGGYCAAKLAMRHSDKFAAAGSVSGYFKAIKDATTGDLWAGSKALRNENDLIWRLENRPPPPVSILVASARKGEKKFPEAERFVSLAKPPLQVDTAYLPEGGHNLKTFGRLWPETLRWMSGKLRVN
jgi:enterochelin esterase-like enzyme